jgi:hypothetical protein
MRMLLERLPLETTVYSEGASISFTVYTYGEDGCAALNSTLASPERILDLERGGEQIAVRVREHEIWPPPARRYGDSMQRHVIQLETIGNWSVPGSGRH